MTNTNTIILDSISQLPAWIKDHPRKATGSSASTDGGYDRSWDRGLGFKGAMDMAANGGNWEEGAAAVSVAHVEMEGLKNTDKVPMFDLDVAGYMPDVEAFLSGDPCNMWNEEEGESDQKPIISLGVQLYIPCHVDQQRLFNRGAAILSVIDDLEGRGYRVELWGCVAGISHNKKFGIDLRVKLKGAEEHWSPASVAFGLCHAATARRLGFRVVEAFKDADKGYLPGHAGDWSEPVGAEFDVWFPYMTGNVEGDQHYSTAEKALDFVVNKVKGGINAKL